MVIFSFIGQILHDLFEKKDRLFVTSIYTQTCSTFFTANNVCQRNKVLRRRDISYAIFKKVKHVSLYHSAEVHFSAKAYGIAAGVNQKKIKLSSKEYVA